MLLLSMTIPLLPIAVVVVEPLPRIAFVGRFAPEGPILQKEIVLLSFPLVVFASVEKKTVAPFVATEDETAPRNVQRVMVLEVAPPMNRMVDVPDVGDAVVFSIESASPPVFNPSMVTLSAPFKSIMENPGVAAPLIVLDEPPDGRIRMDVYEEEPLPLALSTALAAPTTVGSVVLPTMSMVIAPVCVPALMAANASDNVAYEPAPGFTVTF
jgi:hypothetical protein